MVARVAERIDGYTCSMITETALGIPTTRALAAVTTGGRSAES